MLVLLYIRVLRSLPTFYGPQTRVIYDKIFVNVGNAWNSSSNEVIVPMTGVYLIELTAYVGNLPVNGNGNEHVQVMVNENQPITELQLDTSSFADFITRSRANIVYLNAGDHLTVAIPTSGSLYFSGPEKVHAFNGMLLSI